MKLSQLLQSKSILIEGDNDGRGSWGIFLSPKNTDHVVKLFCEENQFDDEKRGYDKVLDEPSLIPFANQYEEILVELDTSAYPHDRTTPPFEKAILIPYLSALLWENVGKLGTKETDKELEKIGINVEELKNNFNRVGIAAWEVTLFVNTSSNDVKAIDFTYSKVVADNYIDHEE